ncbi:MAG: DUF711 family protein [Desulfurellaceae bacterium]|nr:DUF711 family protein [Desulfurellaceae bacterium]
MKVRAITLGVDPGLPLQPDQIAAAGRFASSLRSECEAAGLEVQTVRLATPPFPAFLGDRTEAEVLSFVTDLEACCQANGIEYCSIGPIDPERASPHLFGLVPRLIAETSTVFTSAVLAEPGRPVRRSSAWAIGQTIQTIARTTAEGFGNLRFAAVLNCGPHIPFFPAAFHHGQPAFCLALEAADIVAAAAQPGQDLDDFRAALVGELERQIEPLQQLAQRHHGADFVFRGIDLSPAPGPGPEASIAYAIERLGLGRFGMPGTLAVAAQITTALKETRLQACGYSGLMLPVLEDVGLAERNNQGVLRLSSLLSYSAVCGTGLDTIPLAGDVSLDQLAAVLSDVAALGWKLAKPLSARLLPIPGKRVGETTQFDFAYFVNTRVMAVD